MAETPNQLEVQEEAHRQLKRRRNHPEKDRRPKIGVDDDGVVRITLEQYLAFQRGEINGQVLRAGLFPSPVEIAMPVNSKTGICPEPLLIERLKFRTNTPIQSLRETTAITSLEIGTEEDDKVKVAPDSDPIVGGVTAKLRKSVERILSFGRRLKGLGKNSLAN